MPYTLLSNPERSFFLKVFNTNNPNTKNKPDRTAPRKSSGFSSASYQRSLRRAFARAKALAYFNPDLNQFITLTYAKEDNTIEEVLYDMKQFIRKTKRHNKKESSRHVREEKQVKYIFIMEYQKRGSIHVHMIANDAFRTHKNKNGYLSLTDWDKGYTSVLTIRDFDQNFKPYLYLFKYMHKAQRIGKSFIHTSRNFAKIEKLPYNEYLDYLTEKRLIFTEDYYYVINETKHRIIKEYYGTEIPGIPRKKE